MERKIFRDKRGKFISERAKIARENLLERLKRKKISRDDDNNGSHGHFNYTFRGRRVVELDSLANDLWCNKCNAALSLKNTVSEIHYGLASALEVMCLTCNNKFKVHTCKAEGRDSQPTNYSVNEKLVTGMSNVGLEPSQVNTFLSSLNIPRIKKNTIKLCENMITDRLIACGDEELEKAIMMKKKMKLENKEEVKLNQKNAEEVKLNQKSAEKSPDPLADLKISDYIKGKINKAMLSLDLLKETLKTQGEGAVICLLSESVDGHPRVTSNKKIIDNILEQLKKLIEPNINVENNENLITFVDVNDSNKNEIIVFNNVEEEVVTDVEYLDDSIHYEGFKDNENCEEDNNVIIDNNDDNNYINYEFLNVELKENEFNVYHN